MSSHRLHVSLIVTTLLLQENQEDEAQTPQSPKGGGLQLHGLYDCPLTSSFLVRTTISLSRSSIWPFSLSASRTESDNLTVDTITSIKQNICKNCYLIKLRSGRTCRFWKYFSRLCVPVSKCSFNDAPQHRKTGLLM